MPQWALTKVQPELARSHAEATSGIDLGHVSACGLSSWSLRHWFNLSVQGVTLVPLRA
jgi:hypothetical protein